MIFSRIVKKVSLIILVVLGLSCQNSEKLSIDYHVHIQSPEMSVAMEKLCGTFIRCKDGKIPSSSAENLLLTLDGDSTKINRAVIMSMGYMASMPELELDEEAEKKLVRRENEFTANEASESDKLYSFFSVNPVKDYAIDEVKYWVDKGGHSGLKLHLANSDINLHDEEQINKIQELFKIIDDDKMTILIHLRTRNPDFGAQEVEIVISKLIAQAPKSTFIIAHAASWGGFDNAAQASLATFTKAINNGTLDNEKVFLDIAAVIVPEEIRKHYPIPEEELAKEAETFVKMFR